MAGADSDEEKEVNALKRFIKLNPELGRKYADQFLDTMKESVKTSDFADDVVNAHAAGDKPSTTFLRDFIKC